MANIAKGIRKELNVVLAEITRLQQQAAGLRIALERFELKENDMPPASPTAGAGRPKRDDGPSALVQAIIGVIRANGSPMHYKDIHSALIQSGVPVKGQDPVRNVSAHISLNKEFFKSMGSGMWGLSEWSVEQAKAETVEPDEEPDEDIWEKERKHLESQ